MIVAMLVNMQSTEAYVGGDVVCHARLQCENISILC